MGIDFSVIRAIARRELDKLRDATPILRLMPRTAREPHADAHRTNLRHPLREKTEPIRQHLADDCRLSHGSKLGKRRSPGRAHQRRRSIAANY